jgi:CHRD domain
LFITLKNISHATLILAIASLLSATAATVMTNMPNAFATTEVYSATLSGDKEVPPVDIQANGTAGFSQPHFDAMKFGLQVSGLDKVIAAHIHQGKEGENGPIVVTLFKADNQTGTGPLSGQLAGGNITNALLEGPLAGKFVEADLAKAMQNGELYVNVHTTEHPDGAIRGQILSSGTR